MSTSQAPPPDPASEPPDHHRGHGILFRLPTKGWKPALREFLLIVAGVLAALAGQAWWESHQERGREREYLLRMVEELVADSAAIANEIRPGLETKLQALAVAIDYVSGRHTAIPDTLALISSLSLAGRFGIGTLHWSNVTFEDLEGTGNLRLIRDPALRAEIVRHFSDTEWERDLLAARRSGYATFFSRLIPGELFREQVVLDVLRPYDLARVLHRIRSEEVRDMLHQELNYGIFLHRQSQSRAERIDSLLQSIRAALSTGT